ncbi:hypothetical protein RHSIM_RhsimUnG0052700 [Rhododendron simsii]|uniref:Uncharacterized protein n=1 Tax=Rhododendron simsii TaxID=118357 RepID=A0A834L5H1_RHOSS|nr:hypothetical protein RHSIM_RhsimUnG0052700 [Rhododendron simsii]
MIEGGSLKKSKSLFHPPLPDSFGFRMPTARTQFGRIEEYMGIMATQLQSVQTKAEEAGDSDASYEERRLSYQERDVVDSS